MVWSDAADGFYMHGGIDVSLRRFNDLWFYGRQANSWSELSPSGTAPSARSRMSYAMAWSDAADGFYLFGGYAGAGPVPP